MIDAKIDHSWGQGLAFDARIFTGLARKFMRGFGITALEGSIDDSVVHLNQLVRYFGGAMT